MDQALAALPRRTRETLGDRFGALETSARAARSSSHGGQDFRQCRGRSILEPCDMVFDMVSVIP